MEGTQEGIHGHCSSQTSQKPSEKLRKSGPSEDGACGSSTNCNNSTGDGCDNPTTSTSNSCPKKQTKVKSIPQEATASGWDSLPTDLLANILLRVGFTDLFCCKTLSQSCKEVIEDDSFRETWRSEGSITAINYYINDEVWRCRAYDLHSKSWKALKPFSFLPAPDASLFGKCSMTIHGGLMCAFIPTLSHRGELVVFNPLTGENRALPPLLYPRHPALVHLIVDSEQRSFKVVVAGSCAYGAMHLSKKMEVFDSSTSAWTEASDMPWPAFCLNKYHAGVCLNGILFVIANSDLYINYRCVIAFDLEKGEWLIVMQSEHLIRVSWLGRFFQLVESDGKLYLFTQPDMLYGGVHHWLLCIDELEIFSDPDAGALRCRMRKVVRVAIPRGQRLQEYPDYCCVGLGEGKLCLFNTLNRTGVVYEMQEGKPCEELQAPPDDQMGDKFLSMNLSSFTLQPIFA